MSNVALFEPKSWVRGRLSVPANTTVIMAPAVPGQRARLLSIGVIVGVLTAVQFKTGASTDLTPFIRITADGMLNTGDIGLVQSEPGEELRIAAGAGILTGYATVGYF